MTTSAPNSTPTSRVGEYGLGRTYASSLRLNLQHFMWKEVLGSNLLSPIPIKDGINIKIADIGTGTGIWPLDMSREHVSAQIDRFDISLDQCPPPEWLPPNISVRKLDILKPLPEELLGQYDIVHVRLFICVIRDDDPVPVLTNLLKMLKPGGYIQWSEFNINSVSVETVRPELQAPALRKLVQLLRDLREGSWIPRLRAIFAEQGVLDSCTHYCPTSPHAGFILTQSQLAVTEEYSWATLDNSGPEASGPRLRLLLLEAGREMTEGVAMKFVVEVTTGRKPG